MLLKCLKRFIVLLPGAAVRVAEDLRTRAGLSLSYDAASRPCRLGCEGIVSKRLGSIYRRGRSPLWLKVMNPKAPAVTREAEEDWGR
jgi:ATP-dependent DNA ligase